MSTTSTFVAHELSDPPRVDLCSPQSRWLATLTHGARTVTSAGPRRTFVESEVRVTHAAWVHALPAPFDGRIDAAWLQQALAANAQRRPDLLAIGLQYLRGAPPQHEGGLQIAGDAAYGPLVDGQRQEGADFNDYLGVPWTYPDGTVDAPEPLQRHCLDCSGFVRMIWGYRRHAPGNAPVLPLSLASQADGGTLPRRAFKGADGPTMADVRGKSVLDGDGLYARSLRAVRRL